MSLTNPNLWARTSINRGVAPAALTVTTQIDDVGSDFSTTSTSFVDVTGLSVTIANRAGGKFHFIFSAYGDHTISNRVSFVTLNNDGTDELGGLIESDDSTNPLSFGISCQGDTDGRIVKGRTKTSGGQTIVANTRSQVAVIEISGGDNLASQRVDSTADFSTSSTSYIDVTNISLTIGNFASGKYIAMGSATAENNATTNQTLTQLVHGSTEYIGGTSSGSGADANDEATQNTVVIEDTDGSTLKMQARVTAGTGTLRHVAATNGHFITTIEFKGTNTITTEMDVLTSDFTTTSTTYVDLTGLTVTLQSSGKFYTISSLPCSNTLDGGFAVTQVKFGSVNTKDFSYRNLELVQRPRTASACHAGDCAGEVLKLQAKIFTGGTSRWHGDTVKACRFTVLQID